MRPVLWITRALPILLAGTALASPDHATPCVDGMAEGFPCNRVDLMAHVDLAGLGATAGQDGNDIWGWTDATTGKEYALMGVGNGTSFVDVTDPDHPEVLGLLPTHSSNSLWRDIKVYGHYALVVSEASNHGMQVFDLTRLRNVVSPPETFTEDAHYAGFGRAHNIVVNENSGFVYAVGSRQGAKTCNGGLHMIDMSDPLNPESTATNELDPNDGCFSSDGYTHDAQCVMYEGPDSDYTGHEICLASNEDTLTIVDVTNKSSPVQVARVGYPGSAYTHQGWLAPGQRWYLMDDELDEQNHGHNTRTYVWDLQDLDSPQQAFAYTGSVAAIDHNLYVRDQYAFQANYKSGLRILDISGIAQGTISEVAYFDTHPEGNDANFDGAWSNYPFFDSGTVIVSDISRGLFVLKPILCDEPATVSGLVAQSMGDNRIDLSWNLAAEAGASYEVYRELGGCGSGPGELIAAGVDAPAYSDTGASGLVPYGYRVRVADVSGQCRSAFSACVEAATSGACTAPPSFDGLQSAASLGSTTCGVELEWNAATPNCSGGIVYDVHRGLAGDFEPDAGSLIASTADTMHTDLAVDSGQEYHYAVRARDDGNGAVDGNLVRLAATAQGPISTGSWTNGAEEDDVLLGAGTGLSAIRHVAWHAVDTASHSGDRAYYSSYADSECLALTTPGIDLGGDGTSTLSFFQRYGIEDGWDGGRVEISTDGQNWSPLTPIGGYPGSITNNGNACGWSVGNNIVYNGTALGWAQQQFDLSAYSGTIYLRWLFSTDTAATEEGWWIDDIVVSPAQMPGTCSTAVIESSVSVTAHAPQPSEAGDTVSVSFTVNGSPVEAGTPAGSVTVTADAGGESCSASLPATSCDLVLLTAGLRDLTVSYSGDAVFPAAQQVITHDVQPATPTLQLEALPPATGMPGTVDAVITITGKTGLAAPEGTVTVLSDLEPTGCDIVLPATSCQLTLSVAGLHTLTATYSGDASYSLANAQTQKLIYDTSALFGNGFE